jgi:hypothetical protein
MDLALLVVTSEAYRPLAELTGRLLDRHWPGHPPTFYCGASRGRAGTPDSWLPLRDEPVDWIGITLRAVGELRGHGYRQAYLILDDHPPLFRCHAPHLNRTLPQLMQRLGAASVGLYGWGQGKASRGTILGRADGWLERLGTEYPWKFSLHPALWHLEDLSTILEALAAELPVARRSPWAFERHAGRPDGPLPESLQRRAFRLAGTRMTAAPLRRELLRLERLGGRSLRFALRRLGGEAAAHGLDGILDVIVKYYEGPYPLYRSGVVVRGRINESCLRFLALHGRARLAREIRKAAQMMVPRPDRRLDAAHRAVALDPRASGD